MKRKILASLMLVGLIGLMLSCEKKYSLQWSNANAPELRFSLSYNEWDGRGPTPVSANLSIRGSNVPPSPVATVVLDTPSYGTINLNQTDSYGEYYNHDGTWAYEPGGTYKIRVRYNGYEYSASSVAPGGVNIPSRAATPITWTHEGNSDSIYLYCWTTFYDYDSGSDINSPFVPGYGPDGTYFVHVWCSRKENSNFPYASMSSSTEISYDKTRDDVIKP